MNSEQYLAKCLSDFEHVAKQLNQQALMNSEVEATAGFYEDAACLKLYKAAWASPNQPPLTADSRIFFAVWVEAASFKQSKLFYNIHALKLRQLAGYNIASREFAARFRQRFQPFQSQFPNVSVDFGPLTLMQGFVDTDFNDCQAQAMHLSENFLRIAHLIDETLADFK